MIRLLFALTSIPKFKVLQYDVSVAFIQNKLDSNHPPVYCECAEGYEDRRKYVYRLHCHLYGIKDSPRGCGQLFASVCTDFGASQKRQMRLRKICQQLKESNLKHATNISEGLAFVAENDRIDSD